MTSEVLERTVNEHAVMKEDKPLTVQRLYSFSISYQKDEIKDLQQKMASLEGTLQEETFQKEILLEEKEILVLFSC